MSEVRCPNGFCADHRVRRSVFEPGQDIVLCSLARYYRLIRCIKDTSEINQSGGGRGL